MHKEISTKREREKEIVSQMIALYCKKKHDSSNGLCKECEVLRNYAIERSDRCPFMETKTFCSNCKVHCYKPDMRERIREVMRFSGPRMIFTHPFIAIKHVIETKKREKTTGEGIRERKRKMYLQVKDMKKSYGEGGSFIQVLKGISTGVEKGEMCVIEGTSGSGKSTFLNCIGGLDVLDSGSIMVDGIEIVGMKADKLSDYRRDNLGFIFQFYNLIPNLTIRENIQVCEYLSENPLDMDELLEVLGLTEHQNKFPSQLSGGQQQRCAIARALVKNPKLLLCDEPTGALDSKTSRDILALLEKINEKYGTTMLIVTHNNSIKNMVHKVIRIKDGQISKEYYNEKRVPAMELEDL